MVEIGSEAWERMEKRRKALGLVKGRMLRAALKITAAYASWKDDPQIIEAIRVDLGEIQSDLHAIVSDIKCLPEESEDEQDEGQ